MNSVASLQFHDVPDYNHFRAIFEMAEHLALANATSTDDNKVVLCLRTERTSGVVNTSQKPTGTVSTPTLKKRKLKISPKRFGLRHLQRGKPEVEPEPDTPMLQSPEVIAEAEFEAARARLEKEMSDAALQNPTLAMVEQINRIKMRSMMRASDNSGGRRRER
jgi:hypothetical protein